LVIVDSELPYVGPGLTAGGRGRLALDAVRNRARRDGLLVLLLGLYAAAIAGFGRAVMLTDSWLALVTGRLIASHGLPTHDTLTVFAHGRRWVDQQWLAQLTIYELNRVGGIRLAILIHILLVVGSLAGAMVVARRLGAGPRSISLVTLIAFLPALLGSLQLRTQSLAYPLFVVVLALAAGRPWTWRRLALSLALLCLWANLHGSVILGAGLVALRGVSDLVEDLRTRQRPSVLTLATVALPWPCLLVTPFPLAIPHYYAQTVFNSAFGSYLAQWQPSTLSVVSLPLFALILGFFWLLGRSASGFNRFEKLAGLVLVAFALLALRNWVWLALGAVAFYPLALERTGTKNSRSLPAALNHVAAIAGTLLAVLAAAILAHPQSWFTSTYPNQAARAVARLAAAHPGEQIFASMRWGDWLLWKEPQLQGRVAFDARDELLTSQQFKTIALLRMTPSLLPEIRRRYEIFLVDRTDEPSVFATLQREGQVAYDRGGVLVVSFPRA
jgi:hypothetical protein